MSDKDFDEDLLEEYDTETGQIIESKKERKGSLMKGLAFGLILTVVLELGVGLALDASGNLVHRYLAYMLGLVPILVASFMTRSMVKMALVGAPVLVVASFALPFFLPTVFTGLMTPFLTLIPIINELARIGDTLGVETGAEAIIGPVNQYGIALDFLFGIIVGIFAAMGLAGIARVFTRKFGIFTIFTFIFSMVFIVIGVIVLPYLLVVTSGIAQFGMTFATGGALLGAGTQITATPDGDLDLANQYFSEAEQWFIEAEKTLAGLEALGVFGLIGSANPDVAAIVNNGLALVNAGVDLAKGIAPALAGFGAITQGMEIALESFDTGGGLMLSQATFDEGIDLVEQGFANFTQSIDSIKEAIVTIQEDVDRDELVAALERQGAGDVGPQIDFVFFGLPLLEIALDVFTNDAGTGLIDDPDGIEVDTERSPIVHLLLGAQSMTSVGDQIGQDSDFSGTAGLFNDLIFHLQFVVDALDPAVNLPMGELNDFVLDANAPPELVELKDQIVGTTNFLKDAGDTTIAIGEFGLIASPTLVSMNTTMFFLTDAEDFTTLPGSQFDAA
ncbi:MAG: hypothetical protein ACXAE3_11425, partial [Candidatus Kariarchaeaceae archaeon]